jgi:hypothetical protein
MSEDGVVRGDISVLGLYYIGYVCTFCRVRLVVVYIVIAVLNLDLRLVILSVT